MCTQSNKLEIAQKLVGHCCHPHDLEYFTYKIVDAIINEDGVAILELTTCRGGVVLTLVDNVNVVDNPLSSEEWDLLCRGDVE